MDKSFCDIIFNTSASPPIDESVKRNSESLSLYSDWNCNDAEVDYCLNIYDQILNGDHQLVNDYSSEWESCISDELEETEPDIHQFLSSLPTTLTTIQTKDQNIQLVEFCQNLSKDLHKFCDFDQIDPAVREEMNATENDTVHMDLLTCSAATANCYRDNSQKPIIRSKYGKWTCNGRYNPAIGLGPLSQLFIDNYVSNNFQPTQQPCFQNSINYSTPTFKNHDYHNHNHKIQTEFQHRDYERDLSNELPDYYQLYYNRDYNNLLNDSQNNNLVKNNVYSDKIFKTEIQSPRASNNCQQMQASNSWNINYTYNNYEQNLVQSTYY